jgi:hypothetical protein
MVSTYIANQTGLQILLDSLIKSKIQGNQQPPNYWLVIYQRMIFLNPEYSSSREVMRAGSGVHTVIPVLGRLRQEVLELEANWVI